MLLAGAGAGACEKVPLTEVFAAFTVAEGAYFAEERTLFLFYRLGADQGLGPESIIELTYRTDAVEVGWTPLSELPMVHTHLPVDCGANGRCGSASLRVDLPPRDVGLRLRYHRDGAMALEAALKVVPIDEGPAPAHRSLVVYGVFDERNRRVQWRARHQFPSIRNHEAQELGLRRLFRVDARWHGSVSGTSEANPYGYAFAATCPAGLEALDGGVLETTDRAAFDEEELPLSASTSPAVCARAFVTDARGGFTAPALALKNPEVSPAFSTLRSPIRRNTPLGFVLRPCQRSISEVHLEMQRQRLLLEGWEDVCVDDWRTEDFVPDLVARLRARIAHARPEGADMVLAVALHHDDRAGGLASAVEAALEEVLAPEQALSSPRVSGAWVFDSLGHILGRAALRPLVLWCPADLGDDLDFIPTVSTRDCPLQPDVPDVVLGPFRFNTLPILPTRAQFLTFIEKYGEANAGRMTALTFLSPQRTPVSENVPVGDFGDVTFFNNELVTAGPDQAFSYCPPDGGVPGTEFIDRVFFRTDLDPSPLPLSVLPQVHELVPQVAYPLGLFWEFPFLLRLEYEAFFAGQVSAMSISVPFGVKSENEAFPGARMWERGEFALTEVLAKCTRFCDHPTFRDDGIYEVSRPFRGSFLDSCYRPTYPAPGGGGFPDDP